MLTMNHTAAHVLALLRQRKPLETIDDVVSVLLLPDAIRMYVARPVSHFTEHPITGKVSTVVLNTTPDNLKGIKYKMKAELQPDIPKAVVDEKSHPEVFRTLNPEWIGTRYEVHLHQDLEWDRWLRTLVDHSKRYEDKFTYIKTGRVVDGATYRKELFPMDDLFFIALTKKIKEEFGVTLDADWFEKHIHKALLRDYDEELAINTWNYINIPSWDKKIVLPEYVSKEDLLAEIDRIVAVSN